MSGKRVLYGVTAPVTAQAFLVGQLSYLRDRGWEVHLLCGASGLAQFAVDEGVAGLHEVPAVRDPSLGDLRTFVGLVGTIRRVRPDVCVLGTPKVGVFGTLAAWVARVPVRVYLMHGYRGEAMPGPVGRLMRLLDRLACVAATHVVAVSPSLRDRLVGDRVVSADKVVVLGSGSANGVDVERFQPPTPAGSAAAREGLGVPASAQVVAFVGRLTRDKGLTDLPDVWRAVATQRPDAWLVVAGAAEPVDDADERALAALAAMPRVRVLGPVAHVEDVYRAADVLLLLTRREGLGMVALEAAACAVPTVGLRATGVVDAVTSTQTGVLVDDPAAATVELAGLLGDEARRKQLGAQACDRVMAEFEQTRVWDNWDSWLRSVATWSEEQACV